MKMRRSYEKPSERRAREKAKPFAEPETGTQAAGTRRLCRPASREDLKGRFPRPFWCVNSGLSFRIHLYVKL